MMRIEVFLDSTASAAALRNDVVTGLTSSPKTLSPTWFYDERGCELYDEITKLAEYYPFRAERSILTNHAMQVVFAPREQQDANDYSEMLGYTTVRRTNVTRGREVSRSETFERRALMLPQELKALGPEKQVLLCEGLAHPVLCDKLRYYRDRRFTRRLLPKVEVPQLQV